jgi:hypothetical protein
MTNREQPASASQWLLTAGIITFSLISGVVLFAVIVLLVLRSGRPFEADPWSPTGILTTLGLVVAVTMSAVAYVLPQAIARRSIASTAASTATESPGFEGWGPGAAEMLPALMTSHIIRLALLEGAAFLNLIAYMQEGKAISLAAAGVLVVLMMSTFLTESRVRDWLDRMRESLTTSP